MVSKADTAPNPSEDPEYFVVEVGRGDDIRYAVCRQTFTVDGREGLPGLSASALREYFKKHAVRAIPLPTADPCDGVKTMSFLTQSGVNITINVR